MAAWECSISKLLITLTDELAQRQHNNQPKQSPILHRNSNSNLCIQFKNKKFCLGEIHLCTEAEKASAPPNSFSEVLSGSAVRGVGSLHRGEFHPL